METWIEPFLKSLRENGNVLRSCEAAGIERKTAYNHKNDNASFSEQWALALEDYNDLLISEIDRRGRKGYEEPVFFQGAKVDTVTKYSDNLLMFEAKKRMPEYRDRVAVDIDYKQQFLILVQQGKITPEQIEANPALRLAAARWGIVGVGAGRDGEDSGE